MISHYLCSNFIITRVSALVSREMKECFDQIGTDEDCRSVVLAAQGRVFTAGMI